MPTFKSIFFFLGAIMSALAADAQMYLANGGSVAFTSDAPLELIEGESQKLRGVINLQKNTFAFMLDINSFEGFNSQLQREHFRENYMETGKYPSATFKGVIDAPGDLLPGNTYDVTAKGTLTVHGVEQERSITGNMAVMEDRIVVSANFLIPLSDHDIKIPTVLFKKLASEVVVDINADFLLKED